MEKKTSAEMKIIYSRLSLLVLRVLTTLSLLLTSPYSLWAISTKTYITLEKQVDEFPLSVSGKPAPICVSSKDFSGVRLILSRYFASDIEQVTGTAPAIFVDNVPKAKDIVIIGTIGKSLLLDRLISTKKIDVKGISGEWEAFLIQPVDKPFPGVERALVVAGSDKRGTIYGMFDISEKIGVSPWHWWADVPIRHHKDLYVLPGRHTGGPPSVRYRGIFLNDE